MLGAAPGVCPIFSLSTIHHFLILPLFLFHLCHLNCSLEPLETTIQRMERFQLIAQNTGEWDKLVFSKILTGMAKSIKAS
jgi:hypothetical protein